MYYHIVSFKFSESASDSAKKETHERFVALKDLCQTAEKDSYIIDVKAGLANVSPEGFGKDFDHTYVLTYNSAEDFKYYLEKDPAHQAFSSWVRPNLSDAFIYDFEA